MNDMDFWLKQSTIDVLAAAYLLAGEPLPQELSHSVNDTHYPPKVTAMIRLIHQRTGAVVRVPTSSRKLKRSHEVFGTTAQRTSISQTDFKQLIDEISPLKLGGEQPANSASPQKMQMTTKERNSLLRIIRALDVMAKLPDRGPATSVHKQLQELGFQSPSDDTIRKVLSEARKLEVD